MIACTRTTDNNTRHQQQQSTEATEHACIRDNAEYQDEPHHERDYDSLVVRTQRPFNAEVKPSRLTANYITDTRVHFKRNHGPIPSIDPHAYRLIVSNTVTGAEVAYDMDAIQTKFPKTEVVAALQCAGNRRDGQAKIKPVNGVIWATGTISNSRWVGVPLYCLLAPLLVSPPSSSSASSSNQHDTTCDWQNWHVEFEAYGLASDDAHYGSSIPLAWVLNPRSDILLAYEMNSCPLPRDHGYPLRVIVPGVIGARWVKWVHQIRIQPHESNNYYQQRDYKILPPMADKHNCQEYWSKFPAIHEFNVQSVTTSPQEGQPVMANSWCQVQGYAVAGGGRMIDRVEVSVDGGTSWQLAELFGIPGNSSLDGKKGGDRAIQKGQKHWAWTLWTFKFKVSAIRVASLGELEIACRAWDCSGNCQPSEASWNYRGVMNNSYFRTKIKIIAPTSQL